VNAVSQVNPKFYVISLGEIRAGVAAARFLAAQRRARHEPADGNEGGDAAAIVANGRVPFVERLDGRSQQRFFSPQAD
jgi:hypothetical protein